MSDVTRWNRKYWDALDKLYWSPKYIGLKSISKSKWRRVGDEIRIPADEVKNGGSIYTRERKAHDHVEYLHRQEETLNQIMDLTFGIASEEVIQRLFCEPFGFEDTGKFESLGREIRQRYGWSKSENVTEADGYFVSEQSAIGVEIKLGAKTSPDQVLKYAALIAWEEKFRGRKHNLGLLYIVPKRNVPRLLGQCGIQGSDIDASFFDRKLKKALPKRVSKLCTEDPDAIRDVLDRLRLHVMSWADLTDSVRKLESALSTSRPGDKTLRNLLSGFRAQIEEHSGTGIAV